MSNFYKDKVVLITGGNAGIGRATALAFAKEGAKIVVAARRVAEGEKTVSKIKDAGGEACFVQTDVSKASEVKALVEETVDEYGGLDFAFNNAGIEGTPLVSTIEYDEDVWNRVIDINLKGVWLCMKYEIPQMLKRGGGAIVNMSSIAGLEGGCTMGIAYFASKHGVIGLTKTSALEFAAKGIRINAICPAWIATEMADRVFFKAETDSAQEADSLPMGRVGKPEEVAAAVVWLCSDASSFITGHALPIDGGVMAG